MLTDYHTHLRPDDVDAAAASYFTERNFDRYALAAAEHGVEELGFSEHVYRFQQALEIWRHPFWEQYAVDDLDHYCDFVRGLEQNGHTVKLGIECDYVPGREREIARLLEGRPFDYVIGSVHFIADRAVDHEDYDAWRRAEPDEVWSAYFDTLGAAAASGLFDILAHPDLVKVWGSERPLPSRERRAFYDLAIERIAESELAIEVSTAGLRKPVGEIYPAPELLQMCLQAGRPVALSSDAHEPGQVAYGYESAIALLREQGVEEIATFAGRRMASERLG